MPELVVLSVVKGTNNQPRKCLAVGVNPEVLCSDELDGWVWKIVRLAVRDVWGSQIDTAREPDRVKIDISSGLGKLRVVKLAVEFA